MFCPGCKRDVVGKKVFDWRVFWWGCLVCVGIILVNTLLGRPYAGLGLSGLVFCVLVGGGLMAWWNAPLACPICQTRLVNPNGKGDEPPAYKDKDEAYQSSRQGFCHACKAVNNADAVYCSKCGKELPRRRPPPSPANHL